MTTLLMENPLAIAATLVAAVMVLIPWNALARGRRKRNTTVRPSRAQSSPC